jgi:DNA-binding Xre family transcriptional regulator
MSDNIYTQQKQSLIKFMAEKGLNPNSWAKLAGISEATIRHFISGRSKSITSANLAKLAMAANADVVDIIGEVANKEIAYDIDRELFIKSYCEIADFINNNFKNIPPQVCANIILSWYEISKLKNRDSQAIPFQDLVQKLTASAK